MLFSALLLPCPSLSILIECPKFGAITFIVEEGRFLKAGF